LPYILSAARQRSGSDTEEDDARAKIRAALRAGDTGEE
jgi:hypothetical protein